MATQIYALLVGINDYPPHVGKLYGCVNDAQHVHDYPNVAYVLSVKRRCPAIAGTLRLVAEVFFQHRKLE
jgi:hypothetical protein